jgi:hypothetical protein
MGSNRGWVIGSGAGSIGFVVGSLIGFFIDDMKRMTRRDVAAVISIAFDGGIMAVLRFLSPDKGFVREYWIYPVGVAIGFVFALMFDRIAYPNEMR